MRGFKNQLIGCRAIGRHHPPQGPYLADVAHQGARIDIPNDRDVVTIQIKLRGLRGAPVGRDWREFADDQGFDVRPRGLLILEVGSDVSDMWISEADDLARVTRIGENFLVSGNAGIENNFAAPASDGAGGPATKATTVFQCQYSGPVENFCQGILRAS